MADNKVTTPFLYRQFAGLTKDSTRDPKIAALIDGVCDEIAIACNRTFSLATYREWLNSYGSARIRLDNWPIKQLYQVSIGATDALIVTYNGDGMHADASFDGTSVLLHDIDSVGVETDSTLAASDYPTLTLMAAAITALDDWTGSVLGSVGATPTQLMRQQTNRMIECVYDYGALDFAIGGDTAAVGGYRNVFVWYKAGYTLPVDSSDGTKLSTAGDVPKGLTTVANQIIKDVYDMSISDASATSESLDGHTIAFGQWTRSIIDRRLSDLSPYRNLNVI
jgi:hypothetical protein